MCLQEEKNTGNTLGNLGNLKSASWGTPLGNTTLLPVTPAVTQNGTGGTKHTLGEHYTPTCSPRHQLGKEQKILHFSMGILGVKKVSQTPGIPHY